MQLEFSVIVYGVYMSRVCQWGYGETLARFIDRLHTEVDGMLKD